MTTKERIETALTGGMPDQIPFTVYRNIAHMDDDLDDLMARGMGFTTVGSAYSARNSNIEVTQEDEVLDGVPTSIVKYSTPVGEIWQRSRTESGYGSSWSMERFVKSSEDYKVLEFIIRNTEYSPNYDAFSQAEESLGDTGIIMAWIERVPLQRLWIQYAGIERLSMDLYDNLSAVKGVLEAMMDKSRETWKIVADSPAKFIWCPDNITGVIAGPPLFDKYCIPYYNELTDLMHKNGKRVLCHMDGMMKPLVDSVRKTDLDVIEAFTPPPDGNLSLAEAREAWEDKVISINFPSSVHIADPATIRDTTLQILREAAPGNGFVIGVTENVPKSVGTRSLRVIADTINEYGACPISI